MPPILAIANRAEIAVRVARTARQRGWQPVVLLGDPDLDSYAARAIGLVEPLGPAGSELDVELVVAAALRAGATALHPGYGFLSERPELSSRCAEAGLIFIGPSPETLAMAGDKLATRAAAERVGAPLLPASEALTLADEHAWEASAEQIGYPVIAKVVNAGGGRGLRVVREPAELARAINSALNEAGGSGSEARLFLERYVEGARHVEVQVAGDGVEAVALGDRDCSLQRRHQKVIEEAPAPGLSDSERDTLWSHAVRLAREIGLQGLATVEFLHASGGEFYFLEINPRLQVEHTVTDEVTGLDLVAIQLELATGGALPESVPSHYDPLIAKLIAHGNDRNEAINRLMQGLRELAVTGVATNRPWLLALLTDSEFRANRHTLATADTVQTVPRPPTQAELKAVASSLEGTPRLQVGAWSSSGPFRIVQDAVIVFHGSEAGGWQQSVSPETLPEPGTFAFVHHGRNGYELVSPNGRWLVELGPLLRDSDAQRTQDGILRAPMPGKVLAINVDAGQAVNEGDVVAVLEAMKIEITLAAPFAGIAAEIHADPGDLVSSRQPVVTITPQIEEQSE